MEEEANLQIRGSQIVVKLALGVSVQPLGRLDLDHEPLVDDHVQSLMRDLNAAVADDGVELAINVVSALE